MQLDGAGLSGIQLPDAWTCCQPSSTKWGTYLGLDTSDAAVYDVMAGSLPPGTRFPSLDVWSQSTSSPWTATVDYGDGSGEQPLTLNEDKTFGLAHEYTDNGTYTVTVSITDPEGLTSTDEVVVTVNNVAPFAMIGNDGPVDEGDTVTVTLSNPADPSPTDTTVGFGYSYALDTYPSGDDLRRQRRTGRARRSRLLTTAATRSMPASSTRTMGTTSTRPK